LYSLSELYDIQGDETQSYTYAQQLIENHPETEFAQRLTSKFDLSLPQGSTYSEVNPIDIYYDILNSQTLSTQVRAEELAKLAIEYSQESFSDRALYDSIQEYIKLGKSDSAFISNYDNWIEINQQWETDQNEFNFLKDSLEIAFNDSATVFTKADSLFYINIQDSILTKPDFNDVFPYQGAMWDSTRSKIDLFGITFNNSRFSNLIRSLKLEFEIPVVTEVVEEESTTEEIISETINSDYISCMDQNFTLDIRGGIQTINSEIQISREIQETSISFLFYVNQRGIIDEFKLSSDTQNETLISTYVEVIDELVSFEPVLINGLAQKVACEIEFTVPRSR
jgi:hypothetical protein